MIIISISTTYGSFLLSSDVRERSTVYVRVHSNGYRKRLRNHRIANETNLATDICSFATYRNLYNFSS